MARKIVLHTGFWHRNKINKLGGKNEKLVMAYLLCNPSFSRTGIYTIYSEAIASGIGRKVINAEEVREALVSLEKAELIRYEHEADVVYILEFGQYSSFNSGKPIIVAMELLADFEEIDRDNSIVMGFWCDYIEKNKEKLTLFNEKLLKSKSNPDKISIRPILDLILLNKN
jgi:CRISPR/Cas system-associated protein Cas7 (RAMP superfamily)